MLLEGLRGVECHQILRMVQFMLELEGKDVSLALLRKLEVCESQAREQRVGLESRDEPDTAEVLE